VPIQLANINATVLNVGIRGNGTSGPTCVAYVFDVNAGVIVTSQTATSASTSFVNTTAGISYNPATLFSVSLACGHLSSSAMGVSSISYQEGTGGSGGRAGSGGSGGAR